MDENIINRKTIFTGVRIIYEHNGSKYNRSKHNRRKYEKTTMKIKHGICEACVTGFPLVWDTSQ